MNLECLWLNGNRLKKINNLDSNFRIKVLYAQVRPGGGATAAGWGHGHGRGGCCRGMLHGCGAEAARGQGGEGGH